ncbi:hypothetical protein BDV96DRAFT_632800 [Lophiotrema nucula]|uniref:Uncharacterized protein n=1 Tax=Lophiotrema nucula TaxID=690887 RepID=A0A6A5Z3C8_9PLEO|nr:hypothetical protein BDV96DRAFT_632800 [Lophiotrema nucula]
MIAVQRLLDLGKSSPAWQSRVVDWVGKLASGEDAAWAGFLLILIPRLETLDIEIVTEDGRNSPLLFEDRYSDKPLQELFGRSSMSQQVRLGEVPGLKSLRRLYWWAGRFDPEWHELYNLQHITLPQQRYALDQPIDAHSSHKHQETSTLAEIHPSTIDMLSSACHPGLKKLVIVLFNESSHLAYRGNNGNNEFVTRQIIGRFRDQTIGGDCSRLTRKLKPLAPTLEKLLVIASVELKADYFDLLDPIDSFGASISLRTSPSRRIYS